MTWRYTTLPDCTRLWQWYANVGAPEPVQTAVACVRAAAILGALALPQTRPIAPASSIPVTSLPYANGLYDVAPSWAGYHDDMPLVRDSIWTAPATMPGLRTDNAVALSFAPAPLDVPEPAAWLLLAVPVLLVVGVRL